MPRPEFYLRYYVGHRGKFGHEFMEFEFASTGKLRYANNSNYKNDSMIRKEVTVSDAVLDEIERIITDAEITKEDDSEWPEPDRVGRQELEVISNGVVLVVRVVRISQFTSACELLSLIHI